MRYGKHKLSGKTVAVKVVAIKSMHDVVLRQVREALLAQAKEETKLLKKIDHPHIVKLLDSFED
jgi:serine/threonine protein kinase